MPGLEPVLLPLLTPLAGALGKLAFIGLRKCNKKYSQYKEERKEQGTENTADPIESALRSAEEEVNQRCDQLAVLGPKFVRGDCRRDLYDINRKGKVFDIQQKISELSTQPPGKDRSNAQHDLKSLYHSIKLAGEDIVGVLESWAFRLVSENWPYRVIPQIHNPQELLSYVQKIPTSFPVEQQALYYCDSAIALQHNPRSAIQEITIPQRSDLPLTWTCKFCFLEISDHRRPAMTWNMGAWNSLGMSHVVACVSYTDRRAAFKCIDCDDLESRKICADPALFIQHVKVHQEERRQARMNKSPVNNREGVSDRAISTSAYEMESSLDKHKPKFEDPDSKGEKLEREISKELGEEVSDDSQDGEPPRGFESHKKVPLAATEPRTETGDSSSEIDEEASSVASDEDQLRWGDPESTTMVTRALPTYTEAVRASHSRDAGQDGHRPGKAEAKATSLSGDVKTRPMAKESIQQDCKHDLGEAGAQNMHRTRKKQEASDSTGQRRPDLRETNDDPVSYSLYNEHVDRGMLHEMEARNSKISPSAREIHLRATVSP